MAAGLNSAAELLQRLGEDNIEQFWVAYHDYSGRACAKTAPEESFRSTVQNGIVFALANLDMDINDRQVADATLLADAGDFLAVPDPRSYALLPRFANTAIAHAWMRGTDGSVWQGCPRTRLEAAVERLAAAGFSTQCAFEPEFYLLRTGENGEYEPINNTRMFSLAGLQAEESFVTRVIAELRGSGVTVPQFGKEYGPGQYEMSVKHGPPLQALDEYWLLKEAVRVVARECGYIATFMPKPYAQWVGCSLHVHLSLWDVDGTHDLTPSDGDDRSLSDLGRWFLGGLLEHSAGLTGLGSPTVNSYKRLQPGTWAPANAYWGYGNRSGVARIPGVGDRRHIEYRSGDNSCNPALFLTGLLAAGLDGIERQIDPGPPFEGDVGHLSAAEIEAYGLTFLPRTLPEALTALEGDAVLCEAIGDVALQHFLAVKRNEFEQYQLEVHPWERATYLEVI